MTRTDTGRRGSFSKTSRPRTGRGTRSRRPTSGIAFTRHQPDLNFDNPVVHEELFRVIDFWLEMGVDGVRLDAVPYLYEREETNCENLPETHAFLKKLRAHIDAKFAGRMLLAEANQWPEDAAAYFGDGDECHMNFHFPLMPRMFMALQMEDRFPIIDILEQTPAIPENCQWAIFLRNHDELTLEMVTDEERDYMYRVYAADPRARINLGIRRRLAPLLGNNRRKIELINSLLFSLPGTPIIYYGDEIGMGDNFYLGDRNGVRTPMQWSPDRNAGFSKANPQQLYLPTILDPEYHYESVNVENQQRNVSSLFWWMRRLLGVRQQLHGVLRAARSNFSSRTTRRCSPSCAARTNETRARRGEPLAFRTGRGARSFGICRAGAGRAFRAQRFPGDQANADGLHPRAARLLSGSRCARRGEQIAAKPSGARRCSAGASAWGSSLSAQRLERERAARVRAGCRWFGGKGRVLREMQIVAERADQFRARGRAFRRARGRVHRRPARDYSLPLALRRVASQRSACSRKRRRRCSRGSRTDRVLCDAFHLPEVRADLLRAIARKWRQPGRTRLAGTGRAAFAEPAATSRRWPVRGCSARINRIPRSL